jgi:hypothetical protein
MSAAASNSVSMADAVSELLEEIGDINRRMSRMEAVDPLAEIVARVDALDARMTGLERRFRRPPAFPITVISNEPQKSAPFASCGPEVAPYEPHPVVEKVWDRLINERLKPVFGSIGEFRGAVAKHAGRLSETDATFDRMRAAFTKMSERIVALERRVATAGELNNGGPT